MAHLAYKFAHQLHEAQRHELVCDRGDLRVVEMAGLCHDLGHGPFSHVFEREFLTRSGVVGWEHEDMSARMLDFIIDDNAIDSISPDDVKRVKSLITAAHGGGQGTQSPVASGGAGVAPWLCEIVANGRNGIDVDKFDYLARDAHYCGMKMSVDFARIMQFSRVIGDEIVHKYTGEGCVALHF